MRVAIILAAGSSRRFGRQNKLLAQIAGRPLLAYAITAARRASEGRVIVVTGADRARISWAVRSMALPGISLVHAAGHRNGMGASLAAGLTALRPIERQIFLFLGDAPFVAKRLPRALMRALGPGVDAARPMHKGIPGHPVLVRTMIARQASADGDRGLATLLRREQLRRIEGGPWCVADIDTLSALIRARTIAGRRAQLL